MRAAKLGPIILLGLATPAQTQSQPQILSQDQFPNIVQETMRTGDTDILLRCGYESVGGKIQPVPHFNDLTLRHPKGFARYQTLDKTLVGVTLDGPTSGTFAYQATKRLVYNVVTVNGEVQARLCGYDAKTDMPTTCGPATPTLDAARIKAEVKAIEGFCAGTFKRLEGQLTVGPAYEGPYRIKGQELLARHRTVLGILTK
jgi:hypothetical protein